MTLPLIITIPLIPVTKKNSQRIVNVGVRGQWRPRILPSEKYKQYESDAGWFMPTMEKAIDIPCNVSMVYYMPTRRRVDLVNLQEATLDVLVRYGVLADDHCGIVHSMDGSKVLYDKENPRTVIVIEEVVL